MKTSTLPKSRSLPLSAIAKIWCDNQCKHKTLPVISSSPRKPTSRTHLSKFHEGNFWVEKMILRSNSPGEKRQWVARPVSLGNYRKYRSTSKPTNFHETFPSLTKIAVPNDHSHTGGNRRDRRARHWSNREKWTIGRWWF
jgi:hypothetical protein